MLYTVRVSIKESSCVCTNVASVSLIFLPQSRAVSTRNGPMPPAAGLIVHMHGGGYVAQSPKGHEVKGRHICL